MFEKDASGSTAGRVSSMIEDFFSNGISRVFGDDAWSTKANGIPVNIKETPVGYDMQVVAPGLSKEDFKIQVDKNLMTVSFDATQQLQPEGEGRWIRQEFKQQSFKRVFTLNDRIDTADIQARYSDGILHINLPKKDAGGAPSQQIQVS